MKVLHINTVYGGSTGKVAQGICRQCNSQGIQTSIAFRYREKDQKLDDAIEVSSWLDCHIHNRLARYTRLHGWFSLAHTFFFLKKIESYAPNIIHLHNLHGSYINVSLLFAYLKSHHIRAVWTLHDCWAFTGQCPHFTMAGCEKWRTGCHHCGQIKDTHALVDMTRLMWRKKREWFTGLEDMTIVTPSQWLADLVKQSFLGDYSVKVIHNGIDLDVFKPTESDLRQRYGLEGKHVLLGVAAGWGKRKGLDVFLELEKRLGDEYKIVLVGTNDKVDSILPDSIISIHRTEDQRELAGIYTAADLFVNPTREDNYPTVNMEAIACGTPVLTFRTGGSPESLTEDTGSVVDCDDVDALEAEIRRICTTRPYSKENCLKRAQAFDEQALYREYVELYER